jgi:hypothetical protein
MYAILSGISNERNITKNVRINPSIIVIVLIGIEGLKKYSKRSNVTIYIKKASRK